MAKTLNTKIQLRTDTKANWETSNPILKDGEIAIVCFDNDYKDLKIGNGLSSFNQLSYLYQNEIKTDKITGKDLNVKSIAQGYNVKATPTSLATGIFVEADGQFDVVHGIEAKAKEGDDYSFVFNGVNLPGIFERYQSHGEGTFNVNALSGLSGIYFGETSLYDILQQYYTKSETSSSIQLNTQFAAKADKSEFTNYYKKTETSSNVELNSKFSQIYTKSETSSAVQIKNAFDSIDMSDFYKKNETSSAQQISVALGQKVKTGAYRDGEYSLSSSDLSIVNIDASDYYTLLAEEQTDPNVMYLLSSDNVNAHDQRIINVGEPTLSDDAATKNYVDTHSGGVRQIIAGDHISISPDTGVGNVSVSADIRYRLTTKTPQLSTVTIEGIGQQAYVAFPDDFAINTVTLNVSDKPLYIYLPKSNADGTARDLLVRVEITSATAPTVGFFGQDSESCDFESEDESWATLEPGVNLFNFTETK